MMLPFGDLLLKLAELAPPRTGNDEIALEVSAMDLTLPIESRIGHGGELTASLPRGRWSTGFDPMLSQLTLSFEVLQ
jgi:hypothetical protein